MAPDLHTVTKSCQFGEDYQNYFCYSGFDLVLCCHDCIVGSDFSEQVLIVDYFIVVDIDMVVDDIKLR